MDDRIQATRPRVVPALDPPSPARPVWPWIVGAIVAVLFAVFVWPTLYRFEHSERGTLYRINRVTGTVEPIGRRLEYMP